MSKSAITTPKLAETSCRFPCAGNPNEWCGGSGALSVWKTSVRLCPYSLDSGSFTIADCLPESRRPRHARGGRLSHTALLRPASSASSSPSEQASLPLVDSLFHLPYSSTRPCDTLSRFRTNP